MLPFRSAKADRSAKTEPAEKTLYAELIRRGLPTDYACRTAEELDDHRTDLLADLRAQNADDPEAIANERLGETRALAKRIAGDYQRRSWFGRWPSVSFIVLPPAILAAVWTGLVLTLALAGRLWTWSGGAPGEIWSPVENARLSWGLTLGVFAFVVPASIAWFYGRLALQTTQSRCFVLTACLGIGLLNSLPSHSYRVDPADPELAVNLVMLPFCDLTEPAGVAAACARQWTKPVIACQLLVPMIVGGILLYRDQQRRWKAKHLAFDQKSPRLTAA